MKKNFKKLKKYVIAAFVLTCIGDNRSWSYLKSRYGDTLADKITKFTFEQEQIQFVEYDYLTRGSDERQIGSPGIDIPVVSIMRSKYGTFDEYHTSKDNLDLVNGANLHESAQFMSKLLENLDRNTRPIVTIKGEPFYQKRNMRSQMLNNRELAMRDLNLSNFLAYCDGKNDLIDICKILNIRFEDAYEYFTIFLNEGLTREISS